MVCRFFLCRREKEGSACDESPKHLRRIDVSRWPAARGGAGRTGLRITDPDTSLDQHLPSQQRAADLVAAMKLDEKITELHGIHDDLAAVQAAASRVAPLLGVGRVVRADTSPDGHVGSSGGAGARTINRDLRKQEDS
jgi:hypothetical protein